MTRMKSHKLCISELNLFYDYFDLNVAYEIHKPVANFHSNTEKYSKIFHSVLYSPKVPTFRSFHCLHCHIRT